MKQINRVGVIGAGVMGATIAAHLANSGTEVLLLDIAPQILTPQEHSLGYNLDSPQVKNRIAADGKKGLATLKPAPLYTIADLNRIEIGNLSDNLELLSECDWVIEVVVENLQIKCALLTKIAPHINASALLSSNTSGLPVDALAKALPESLQRRFAITHFFNPPRYMHLLELVPCAATDQTTIETLNRFIRHRLGKGIVFAKDTPNFIANRIGVFAIFNAIAHMCDMGLSVEEVDSVSGVATARPKSAIFRTSDMVGLDTLAHVGNNSYEILTEDEARDFFKLPDFLKNMIEAGLLGDKSGQGFYRKENIEGKRQISFYDYTTGSYRIAEKPRFASVQAVSQIDDPARRIATLLASTDRAAEFAWRSLRDILLYATRRIPEIADDVVNIDNAMRWGFNWEIGPFEILDAIGVETFAQRARADGIDVPDSLTGVTRFYRFNDSGQKEYFDLTRRQYRPVPLPDGGIRLDTIKRSGGVIDRSRDASLLDLGDGVFGLEFHSKMNTIGGGILSMTRKALERTEQDGIGLVIGNQGRNFSVGANLMLVAVAIAEGAYDEIDMMVRAFQKTTMAIKYARVPVVVAPFGMTLGGGCEFALHATVINAHAETYMGMVEVGVGLLPAGGGTKEMCLRCVELAGSLNTPVSPLIFKRFKQIGMAAVSTSAAELYDLGYMRRGDRVSMNSDRLISDAKQQVLSLARTYVPGRPVTQIAAPGRSVTASIKTHLWNMQQGDFITAYEQQIGNSIAAVICGGDVPAGTAISEQSLLDLEREAFLSLCGQKKTAERIQHMLKKGRPLRN